jgi:hypothetical protein
MNNTKFTLFPNQVTRLMKAFLSGVMTSEQRAGIRALLGAADAATDLTTPDSTASTYARRYASTPTQSKEFIAAFLRGDMTSRQQRDFCAYIDTTFAGTISTDRPSSLYGRERALFPIQIKKVIARFLAGSVTEDDQVVLRTLCCFDIASTARVTLYLGGADPVDMDDPDMWHLESIYGPLAGRVPTWDDDVSVTGNRTVDGSIQCHTLTVSGYDLSLTFNGSAVEVMLFKVFGESLTVDCYSQLYGSISMVGENNVLLVYHYPSTHPQATTTTIVCEDNAYLSGNFMCDVYMNGDFASYTGNCTGDVYLLGENSVNNAAPAFVSGTLHCIGDYSYNNGQAEYGVFSGEGSYNDGGIYTSANFSGEDSYNYGSCQTATFSGPHSTNQGTVYTDAIFTGPLSANESDDGSIEGIVEGDSYAHAGSGKTGIRDIEGSVTGSRNNV